MPRAPKQCQDMSCHNRQPCQVHPRGWAKSKRKMPPGWEAKRRIIIEKAKGRCVLCGAPGNQVDHVVAHADGGSDDVSNLRLLCKSCHQQKSNEDARARHQRRRGRG